MQARTTEELRADLQKTFSFLRTLRDETSVKVHLASMEIKAAWAELEPKLEEAEHVAHRAAGSVTEASLDAMKATVKSLQKLAEAL